MSILVVGVNHRSGPLDLLERLALPGDDLGKSVARLVGCDNVREAVVVSTCNRTEIYAVTERFHGAFADVRDFFCETADVADDMLLPFLYAEYDDAAVRHLFEVAAGLDSAVLGESEILGQLRAAWEVAQGERAARSSLNLLFRHAIEVGKRVRTETGIGRGTASVSHAAVELAADRLGSLDGRSVVVLGAGSMGDGIAVALHGAGVGDITVVNRTRARAEALAERVDGVAADADELRSAIAAADLVVTSTGAAAPVIRVDDVVGDDRGGVRTRPLLFVDIAVPRDVDRAVAELEHVDVLDLDDIAAWADRGREQRHAEVEAVTTIVSEEVDRYACETTARQAAPLIAELRAQAESTRQAEIARYQARLAKLDDEHRELVQQITRGMVAKLLHEPSVRLRQQAGTPQGERNAAALADLFDLG